MNKGTTNRRVGNFGSERPIAVSVPSTVARIVAPNPISRLLPMAARQRAVPSTTSYQRVDKPASGKSRENARHHLRQVNAPEHGERATSDYEGSARGKRRED